MKDKKKAKLRKCYWILVYKETGVPVGDEHFLMGYSGVLAFSTKREADENKEEHIEPRRVRVEEV